MAVKTRSKRRSKAPSENTLNRLRAEFETWGRRRGLKRSSQRMAVVDIYLSNTNHVSCEDVYNIVKKRGLNIGYSTVYRTLKLLTEANLAREVNFGDGVTRFDHAYNFNFRNHYHLVCTACGSTHEFTSKSIDQTQATIARRNGFDSQHHKLEIYGLCKTCRSIS